MGRNDNRRYQMNCAFSNKKKEKDSMKQEKR